MFMQEAEGHGVRIVTSASDLTAASACEFAFLRRVDEKLGRAVQVPEREDAMLDRAARLGDLHEERTLADYHRTERSVIEIPRPASMSAADLSAVAEASRVAILSGADVVFQATFFEAEQRAADAGDDVSLGFVGFADFLVRTPDGLIEVHDTKLARTARVTALMQLAAYAEQLERLEVPVSPEVVLILGDGVHSRHALRDIAPVFRSRRARLHEILLRRARATGPDGGRRSAAPIPWGDPGVFACGTCEVCDPEVTRTRDPLLIAGMRRTQRDRLVRAGLDSIGRVAGIADTATAIPVPGIAPQVVERLAQQAAAQLDSERTGAPAVRVWNPQALAAIPPPSPGDLFFDFEGDPLYREPGPHARWGIDYLFGMVDTAEEYTALWAHDLEAEREALQRFIRLVAERRAQYPNMKIYHYASYERTHLLSIAARHGTCEAEVDQLLREHVLVDLYPIVRQSLRVGSRSYSIKHLEPLYMGDEFRDDDGVTSGGESVVEYARAMELRDAARERVSDHGDHDRGDRDRVLERRDGVLERRDRDRAESERILASLADYNRYDCVSTLRLRDWLRALADEHGVTPFPAHLWDEPENTARLELSAVGAALAAHAEHATHERDRRAAALGSAAIDYHEREQKTFWHHHYARLVDPVEDWADTRDVLVVDPEVSRVDAEWHRPPNTKKDRRTLTLRGEFAPGSNPKPGSQMFLVYAHPAPVGRSGEQPGSRGTVRVTVIDRHDDGLTVDELLDSDAAPYAVLPIAVVPGPPPPAGGQKAAIEHWGAMFSDALSRGYFPIDPVVDVLRRSRPRFEPGDDGAVNGRGPGDGKQGDGRPGDRQAGDVSPCGSGIIDPASETALVAGGGREEHRLIGAVTETVRRLHHSALAVQGPPGTGKTYLAARVIRRLVEDDGWHIGVVAQSHRVVEHVLDGVVGAGLDPQYVGKVPQGGRLAPDAPAPAYTVLPSNGQARFVAELRGHGLGSVTGGTAWDFSNRKRYGHKSLDLLVIDEAGQFSLAPTIAASLAADRLLLLGDPQQLPQVSQGAHPEPIDTSALGWVLGEHNTMPEDRGYFLAETRRMHPDLAAVVSELSYEGRLRAHGSAAMRTVSGAGRAGIHWHPVDHSGNATHSPEEAARVVEIVRDALAGSITDPEAGTRRLTEADLIVVAAYNAQVETLRDALTTEGYSEVRVGTVDRFQGQEAVIAIVSLAASSAEDVPRGLEFLLMRNRLNVAISRAQWSAHLVSSRRLGEGLPSSAEGVSALSGYLRLTEHGAR